MAETRSLDVNGLRLTCEAPAGLVVLRVRADDAESRRVLASSLGVALPASPSTPILAPAMRVFWTAPDALLLDAGSASDAASLTGRLARAVTGCHVAMHDASDARTRFVLIGARACAFLAKATSIDLDPRAFPVGAAAMTRFAGLTALLFHRDATPSFEVLVDRPLEAWLWAWLEDATREST